MIDDNSKEFIYRHIGPTVDEQNKMLNTVGYKNLDDLMKNTVPEKILLKEELNIDGKSSKRLSGAIAKKKCERLGFNIGKPSFTKCMEELTQ